MPSSPNLRHALVASALMPFVTFGATAATSAELVVEVRGIAAAAGEIGCALFAADAGFPMDNSKARQLWVPADAQGVVCRFTDVPEGRWAVSIAHDLNGNRKVDTNLFGLPTEAWGVSNNARPTLRPPRFDEAAFSVTGTAVTTLDIKVAR